MDAFKLKQTFLDQKGDFNRRRFLIERDIDLTPYLKTQQVVITSGVRRCGKSSLLFLIKEKLQLQEQEYLYFNFDDERIIHDPALLEQIYLLHLEMHQTDPVFFFDEIQNVPAWERFVNRMHEKGLKLFVTGSNATLLSSEIATSLTGRNKTINLYPFSFAEFLRLKEKSYPLAAMSSEQISLLQSDLNDYLRLGGFPVVILENDLDWINQYFQDILYRDIIARYRITQINELKQMALFLASNVAKLFSYATLQKLSGLKSTQSVKTYVDFLEQSYLFSYLKKFDFSVKKQIMNSRKVYSVDPAFCNRLGFAFSDNLGRVLENVVYLQLLRQGKQVFYHLGKRECDFVIQEGVQITQAIQVVYELNDHNVQRETEGLLEAMHTYGLTQALLITKNPSGALRKPLPKNIQVMQAWQWLLAPVA